MKRAEWNLPRAEAQTVDHQNDPMAAVKKRSDFPVKHPDHESANKPTPRGCKRSGFIEQEANERQFMWD